MAHVQSIVGAGIYLSIPFCRQKCTYCNFASDAFAQTELPRYLRALESEIAHCSVLWQQAGLPLQEHIAADSVYMGGGTPGLLTPVQLTSLLATVRQSFKLAPGAEITLEASPENVTEESAAAWAADGVNRVSLGVQSMAVRELRATGRMHDGAVVATAMSLLRAQGIHNISVDLIAGLPHQTPDSWETTLDAVLRLQSEHISVYMLEVDDDSRLGGELRSGGVRYSAASVPAEEHVVGFYLRAMERLVEAGFEHYEISNFARLGMHSRHNEKHWTDAPYFGFGLDAHSYDGAHRWANTDSLDEYLQRIEQGCSPVRELRHLDAAERMEERFYLGLRRRQGISLAAIQSEFGGAEARSARVIEEYTDAGWLEATGDRLRLTDRGVLFSNEVFAGFLAP